MGTKGQRRNLVSVYLDDDTLKDLDDMREKKCPGMSRNEWIIDAILYKLRLKGGIPYIFKRRK